MTTTTPSTTIQDRIANICDVNSSWAQGLSEIGVLATLDLDLEFEGSIFADVIAEDYDITEAQAVEELQEFIIARRLWEAEDLVRYMPFAINFIKEYGWDAEQVGENIYDFAQREESIEVINAFYEAISGHDDEQNFLAGAIEGWIPCIATKEINEAMDKIVTKRVHLHLDEASEGDGWVEALSLYGLLTAVGFYYNLEEDEDFMAIALELDIEDKDMVKATQAYIDRFVWTREKVGDNLDEARSLLSEWGTEEEIADGLVNALTT